MISIKDMLTEHRLVEAKKYGPCRYMFDDAATTFSDVRDMFNAAIGIGVQVKPIINEADGQAIDIGNLSYDMFSDGDDFKKYIDGHLEKFIDGLGWKCTLEQYVLDRYSRYIVNTAREYGIDISRLSDFVRCLASRLSRLAFSCPTRADLATYAKFDGVQTRQPRYREFLDRLELDAPSMNADIIRPIENFVLDLCLILMRNIYGLAVIDNSDQAKKISRRFSGTMFEPARYWESADGVRLFKRDFHMLCDYAKRLPSDGLLVFKNGKRYAVVGNFGGLDRIVKLIGGYAV